MGAYRIKSKVTVLNELFFGLQNVGKHFLNRYVVLFSLGNVHSFQSVK